MSARRPRREPEVTYYLPRRPSDAPAGSGISEEWDEYLRRRAALFGALTQRRGMPMTYGARKKDGG